MEARLADTEALQKRGWAGFTPLEVLEHQLREREEQSSNGSNAFDQQHTILRRMRAMLLRTHRAQSRHTSLLR